MNNYKILSILRLLKSTIGLFVNSFFVMYFLNISNSNIAKLGVYYILMYAVIFITIFLCKNLCKSKNRINVLRTGIILTKAVLAVRPDFELDFVFCFLAIIFPFLLIKYICF